MANIELDGTNKKIKVDSGDLTLDIPGDIILDADGANVTFKDGGTSVLDLSNSSTDAVLTVSTQDKDLIIKGDDGGSAITAATFDMSDAGTLALNHDLRIADAGYIGSASDSDAIAIASNGVVTFSQAPVFPDGSLNIADIDLDGGTDIGAAIVDADLFLIDDGAGGTMRKTAASRLKTYIQAVNTPCFGAKATANQTSLGSGAWTKVQFDTEYFDVGSGYDASNDKFVVPSGEGGKYYFTASAKINPGNTGDLIGSGMRLTVGGSASAGLEEIHFMNSNPSHAEGMNVNGILNLSAADEVEVYAYHQTGDGSAGSITGVSTEIDTYFFGFKIAE